MCGIFGFYCNKFITKKINVYHSLITSLFYSSESRGREASGLALSDSSRIMTLNAPSTASKFVVSKDFHILWHNFIEQCHMGHPISAIGHTRLVTHGLQDNSKNNQPVLRDGVVLIHNGIINNVSKLWDSLCSTPYTSLDSEVLAAYIAVGCAKGHDVEHVCNNLFEEINGNASIAFFLNHSSCLYLGTNNASLYYYLDQDCFIFASERIFLQRLTGVSSQVIRRAKNNKIMSIGEHTFTCGMPQCTSTIYKRLESYTRDYEQARREIRRCTRCVLPATMPFIDFDEHGVCNFCRNYTPMQIDDKANVNTFLDEKKRISQNPDADSLIMLSGGRDSCYGLHYAVKELGLRPIAYTYDWGLVTDIARRNTARMCGKLGIEHVIVSADIAWKRANVRKNLYAWLKKPKLGMIPLLMAGDKQYLYYAEQVRRANNLPLVIVSENPLELTRFKSGFCGVNEGINRIFNISLCKKLHLLFYYTSQYFLNPRYFNSTFLDNVFAFFSSYFIKHDFVHIFKFTKWNEVEVNKVLIDGYGWEVDSEAKSTWRIGDGTAAFYNYIYYTMAGFTENDTLRSNQIREGMLTRDVAIKMVQQENQPRWNSMRWYAEIIGFNLEEAILAINRAPKLYGG